MSVYVSRANKALVLPASNQIATLFPEAVPLGNELRLLSHGLPEYVMLRRLGYNVPHPMALYYDWAMGTPFKTQKVTCCMMTANRRAYVLNDMGTGKTRCPLWSFDYLERAGLAKKMLVVAPLSTLNPVWMREVLETIPHRKAVVLHGDKRKRLSKLDEDADIYIINHHGLKVVYDELKTRRDIDVLCIDELAVYRNNSDRTKLMREFSKRFEWVWGMTGSPMPNEPTDVYYQAKIVTPHMAPARFTHARDMMMINVNPGGGMAIWRPKPDAVDTAFRMMQPSVRFTLDDVTELPECVYRTVDVEMSDKQTVIYKELANKMATWVDNETVTAVNAGAMMTKLLQVATGWVYVDEGRGAVGLDGAPREKVLREIIEGNSHKLIVFVPYRHAVDGLSKILGLNDPKNGVFPIDHALVHGDVPPKERDRIFHLFQNTNKYRVLLAHPACCHHGLTLTAADTIIWYCPPLSLEVYEQANARISRVGQKHRQQIIHLQATPVERKIYRLLQTKASVQDQLLGMFQEATMERLAA